MAFNIQEMLLGALQSSAGAQNAAGNESSQLTDILTRMGVLNNTTQAAVDSRTQGTLAVEQQALQGDKNAQDAAIQFAQAAGTDITSPENILVQLGQQLRQNTMAAQEAQKNIHAKESMRIIDNPLAWIQGQLTLEQDYRQYNQAAESANLTSAQIAGVTKATDEVQRTQQAIAKKVTDASIAGAAAVRVAEGEAAKAAAEKDHLKSEMLIAQAITQNSAAAAQEAQRQFGLVVSAENLELEHARFEMAKQQFDWEKQMKTATFKEKKSADEVKAALLQQYNAGAQVLGYNPESNWDIVAAKAGLGGTEGTRISAVMEAGGNSSAIGSPRVTATPAGAASMLVKRVYPRGNDATFDSMKKYLVDTWNSKLGLGDGKEATVVANVNAQIKVDADSFKKNAVMTGSFYAPPPIDTITAARSVKATALYQKVLSTAGKDLTTAAPTPIVKLTYEAAKSGVISYEEAAAGLAEFYGQAVNINNVTKRFAQIGIPSQTSFNVKPDIDGINVSADLTNYSSTLRLLTVMKAREQTSLYGNAFLGTPFGQVLAPAVSATKRARENK